MRFEWPVVLADEELTLRSFRMNDRAGWVRLRRENVAWLKDWDATVPRPDPSLPKSFRQMVRHLKQEGRAGRVMSFAVVVDRRLVGQATLGSIMWGSLRAASIGYWLEESTAGHGIMPRSVALISDYAFAVLRLHRLEINVRPENTNSRRVAEKLNYQAEGLRPRYMHINGHWRDHLTYTALTEDFPDGVAERLRRNSTGDEITGLGDVEVSDK